MIQTLEYIRPHLGEGKGSIARIAAAQEAVRDGKIPGNAIMIFPQRAAPGQREGLGYNVAAYCRTLPEFRQMRIVVTPASYGTMNDIAAMYQIGQNLGCVAPCVHFVTDPAHMRRVKLYWWLLPKPPGWTAEFHESEHVLTKKERFIREPAAYIIHGGKLALQKLRP